MENVSNAMMSAVMRKLSKKRWEGKTKEEKRKHTSMMGKASVTARKARKIRAGEGI